MSTPPREQGRIYKKRFIDSHREQGLCIECINPLDRKGSRCSRCLDRRRKRYAQRRIENATNGLCALCSGQKLDGHRCCQKCYLKQVSLGHLGTATRWRELLDLFYKQNGICALSGLPLTLGDNADLDHIIPTARGGGNDLDNLQWVLDSVNHMKNNLLENEFLELISSIYLYKKGGH
jgi:5-methylcytosine-specific restriction endonuclease McrA